MITTDLITSLYRRYSEDLASVRRQQRWFHRRHDNALVRRLRKLRLRRYMLFPALDDLEAEITYLLLRDKRPNVVLEISPNAGWSTTWILSALRDNGSGQLWSYDLHDTSTRFFQKLWLAAVGTSCKETPKRRSKPRRPSSIFFSTRTTAEDSPNGTAKPCSRWLSGERSSACTMSIIQPLRPKKGLLCKTGSRNKASPIGPPPH